MEEPGTGRASCRLPAHSIIGPRGRPFKFALIVGPSLEALSEDGLLRLQKGAEEGDPDPSRSDRGYLAEAAQRPARLRHGGAALDPACAGGWFGSNIGKSCSGKLRASSGIAFDAGWVCSEVVRPGASARLAHGRWEEGRSGEMIRGSPWRRMLPLAATILARRLLAGRVVEHYPQRRVVVGRLGPSCAAATCTCVSAGVGRASLLTQTSTSTSRIAARHCLGAIRPRSARLASPRARAARSDEPVRRTHAAASR